MANEEALACSLNGPELGERLKEWRKVSSQATSRHAEKGRMVSTYPPNASILEQLRRLIAAETECSPFMQFNIEEAPDQVVVELRVPDEMSETLSGMLGLVTEPSSRSL
jgi:hypothetical protein